MSKPKPQERPAIPASLQANQKRELQLVYNPARVHENLKRQREARTYPVTNENNH